MTTDRRKTPSCPTKLKRKKRRVKELLDQSDLNMLREAMRLDRERCKTKRFFEV